MKRDQPLPLSGRFVYTNVEEPTFSAVEEIRRICRIIIDRYAVMLGRRHVMMESKEKYINGIN